MNLSKKAILIKPSLTRQLYNLAKNYPDVIDLTLGDPDLLPPYLIRKAATKSILQGDTRYSPNAGLLTARNAIAQFNSNYYEKKISSNEIMITCGGMEAIYLTLLSIINEGDEVIIPGPYWVNYKQIVEICGGRPVIVTAYESDNFSIRLSSLEKAITKKTKAIILNSPNNPTGRIISKLTLRRIAAVAIKYNIFVISDEVYRSLVYPPNKHYSIWALPKMRDRCIVIDSMSKRFAMTGYRLGYAIAPQYIVEAMAKLQENIAACAPLPAQHAAVVGYGQNVSIATLTNEFVRRRTVIYNGIKSIPGLSLSRIDGTFYAFVNISATGLNSYDFALKLLESKHIAVVPGRTYGMDYDNYVRIAFTLNVAKLKIALKKIAEFVKENQNVAS